MQHSRCDPTFSSSDENTQNSQRQKAVEFDKFSHCEDGAMQLSSLRLFSPLHLAALAYLKPERRQQGP